MIMFRDHTLVWAFFALSWFASAVDAASATSYTLKTAPYVSVYGQTIRAVGSIEPQMVQRIEQITSHQPIKELIITSLGGENHSGMRIGQLVQQRHLRVIVSDVCMSACASYVFAVAQQRTILPNSLVIFHHTASAMLELAYVHGRKDLRRDYSEDSHVAEKMLNLAQISRLLLYEPLVQMDPLCYAVVPTSAGNEVAYIAADEGWVPPKKRLTALGIQFKGYWPTSIQEFAKVMQILLTVTLKVTKDSKFRIVFGLPQDVRSMSDVDSALKKVPECSVKRE